MEKPKKQDFKLRSIKIKSSVVTVMYNFIFSKHNTGHTDDVTIQRTLIPHKDLINQLWDLKDMVIQCEEIDYARRIFDMNGMKKTKEMEKAVEGCIVDMVNKIDVTGIRLAGKDSKRNCIITYRKRLGNRKYSGRSTTAIMLEANVYGFENDLKFTIASLITEIYKYLYEDKYDDVEQGQLYPEDTGKEGDDAKDKKDTKKK